MRARICSAFSCDMFARVVWLKSWGAVKLPIFALFFAARTCHAWLARLTRARGKSSQREGNALFDDFWYFSSLKSTIKEKFLHISSRVVEGADPYAQSPSIANRQNKKSKSIPLFLLTKKAQKKKLQKRKRRKKISRSAECLPSLGDADTHAPRMCQFPPLSVGDTAFPKRRAKTSIAVARKLYFGAAKIKLKHKAF